MIGSFDHFRLCLLAAINASIITSGAMYYHPHEIIIGVVGLVTTVLPWGEE